MIPSLGCTIEGVKFLADNLPSPFSGDTRQGARYTVAIDNGQGQEVHDAILTLLREENDMNEIPQSGPEREKYIISVMQGVKREGEKALNVQTAVRGGQSWFHNMDPKWGWNQHDFRLYEPEVVRYAKGFPHGVGGFFESFSACKNSEDSGRTHYVKRTTGGCRTIPEYEAIPLERGE